MNRFESVFSSQVYEDIEELEEELGFDDTRGDAFRWIEDADGILWDIRCDYFCCRFPTVFFLRQ
ncbi:MAG: hypothetical protein BGO01_07165 [Armatimonadetes bacterium 55-13]|nr:hypothetical protein [Armatimonadota bacterium]ODU53882.1 MAG: hypothetical protein ABT09_00890 [bacterium SCN 57-13]OJU62280.1 MAG: hypothetical protein BGO01_07165 [Armatimonadetes bacterium 55-13]